MPQKDSEWSKMGYALFWLAEQSITVDLAFSEEQVVSAMTEGETASKVAALQGIFTQGYYKLYKRCEDIIRNRIIKDNRILWMDITEQNVECAFVPPFFQASKNEERQKNFNHYWTMYMVGLLSRLYPQKQIVGAKLVGINLFTDLGFEAFDFEKRIPQDNRPDKWITEINSWMSKRIDLMHRPDNWGKYISEIINDRKNIIDILNTIIKIIDNIYIKKYIDSNLASIVLKQTQDLVKQLNKAYLLPQVVVDPYGLTSEGSTDSEIEFESISLSITPYNSFKNALQDTKSSLRNFCSQYIEILISRIKNQEISKHENTNLSIINLFNCAKALLYMQKEYQKLFTPFIDDRYHEFEKKELDTIVTLLNLWNEVIKEPPRGFGLSFNARKMYRESKRKIERTFNSAIKSFRQRISILYTSDDGEDPIKYLLINFTSPEGIDIECAYKELCIKLRSEWEFAEKRNSYRWYLETQWPRMIFVPLYDGLPVLGAFEMPIYRILDVEENKICIPMFPFEITHELYIHLGLEKENLKYWMTTITKLGKLRLLMIQYNQVLGETQSRNNICFEGMNSYLAMVSSDIDACIGTMNKGLSLVLKQLENNSVTGIIFEGIAECIKQIEEDLKKMELIQPLDIGPEKIQQAITLMIYATPHLLDL